MPIYTTLDKIHPTLPNVPTNTSPMIINVASDYVDMQHNPAILRFMDGTPWTLNAYYTQYIGQDDPVTNSNDVKDGSLKQYLKINNFQLLITSAIAQSYDSNTGITSITGAANVFPYITPIVGDVFIGVISDNNTGIFQVTNVEPLSQFKETAWSINYAQIATLTPTLQTIYDSYVISELYFDITTASYGANPLSTQSQYNQLVNKDNFIKDLIDQYYDLFYDPTILSFIYPNDTTFLGKLYDPFLVTLFNTAMDNDKWLGNHPMPAKYNVNTDGLCNPFETFVDALLKQSINKLNYTVVNMANTPTFTFYEIYQRHSVFVSDIDYVVMPFINSGIAQVGYQATTPALNTAYLSPYMLSEEFYLNTNNQSFLELSIRTYLNKQAIVYNDVVDNVNLLLQSSPTPQQLFYHIPLYILLLIVGR